MRKYIKYIPIVREIVLFLLDVYNRSRKKPEPRRNPYEDIPYDRADEHFPKDKL